MNPNNPWSVKNVDPEARALAKKAARAAGMTLGAWLSRTIGRAASGELGAGLPERALPGIRAVSQDASESLNVIETRLESLRHRLDDTIAPIGRAVVSMAHRLEAVEKEQERQKQMNSMFSDLTDDEEDDH